MVGMMLKNSIIILLVTFIELGRRCEGCLKEERAGLLSIKNSFPINGIAFSIDVHSWGRTADCCSWDGIGCDTTTGQVTNIDLSFVNWDFASGRPIHPNFYLNASLFVPFQNLNALILDGNGIVGCLENEGFEKLWGLANLEVLDLSRNAFNNSILASLGGLSSLKLLYLYDNRLSGSIDMKELDGLSNLEFLRLGGNIDRFAFSKDIMSLQNLSTLELVNNDTGIIIESLGYVKNLLLDAFTSNNGIHVKIESLGYVESLSLRVNSLDGIIFSQDESEMRSLEDLSIYRPFPSGSTSSSNFLETLGSMTSLKSLNLQGCGMRGTIPSRQGLCELTNLQSLQMGNNDLSGTLPWCLANMTSLQYLELCRNHFTGNLSASPLKALTYIEFLDLSDNLFKIPISLLPFYNLSNLTFLIARNNQLMAQTEPPMDDNSGPKFQLKALYLSGKDYDGSFPKFLYHQVDLVSVGFYDIKLKGGFPNWLLENNTKLVSLALSNTSLSGPFLLPNRSHTNISYLDVSANYFDGHIPTQIGEKLPNLNSLNMSRSGFNGRIPPSLGDMNSLRNLDLSNNVLSGGIPEHLAMGCSSLQYLKLSNNNLEGQIFSGKFNLTRLVRLQLDRNRFSGSVPEILFNSTCLGILDLSNNLLSGNLPSTSLSLASTLQEVYLSRNMLEGSLGDAFYECRDLWILDLSHNGLTGTIPEWYDRFSRLNFLLLSHNNLKGEIPLQLCNLDELSLIDLSVNKLSGQVPPCLKVSSNSYRTAGSDPNSISSIAPASVLQHFEFTIKGNSYPYHGTILDYISGIDLSSNNLTGEIPPSIGYLVMIQVLNLSRNSLMGPIPVSFSNLMGIESLDLSHNMLNGKIPLELVRLNFLAVFNVAHNNLSGRLPNMVGQFATFNTSSYEENPFLCGPPLPKSCTDKITSPSPTSSANGENDDDGFMEAFYVTFSVAYVMVLLGTVVVLYINPHWRRAWFYFIEVRIANCYYFLMDNLPIPNKWRHKLSCL